MSMEDITHTIYILLVKCYILNRFPHIITVPMQLLLTRWQLIWRNLLLQLQPMKHVKMFFITEEWALQKTLCTLLQWNPNCKHGSK